MVATSALVLVFCTKLRLPSTSSATSCWCSTMPASDGVLGSASCASTVPAFEIATSTTSGEASTAQPTGDGGSTAASGIDVALKPLTTATNANEGRPVPRVRYVEPVQGSDRAV